MVKPAEIAKEQPYIAYNIDMTNKAYGLDAIQEVEFSADGTLTAADLQEEMDTLQNIRLIDYRPTITVFNQLQTMRLYYKFVDVTLTAMKSTAYSSRFICQPGSWTKAAWMTAPKPGSTNI